jgi:hypothetical protein
MFTYDEWGNSVWHIQTGREGIELFKNIGIKNIPKEEYEKHMNSYRKLKEKENIRFQEMIGDILKWCKT